MNQIQTHQKALCSALDTTPEKIRSSSRKREIREKRQIICYILRVKVGLKLKEITEIVNRHHSTVIHSVRTIENEMKQSARIDERVFRTWASSFANARADRGVEPGNSRMNNG